MNEDHPMRQAGEFTEQKRPTRWERFCSAVGQVTDLGRENEGVATVVSIIAMVATAAVIIAAVIAFNAFLIPDPDARVNRERIEQCQHDLDVMTSHNRVLSVIAEAAND